ncbi:MAG TPA: lipase maturation factor family protein [Candidatus Limnocylindria bacterium]|nr:lipase maturation factor family protein [Candidatus Limnocylindria bacterium]
MQALSASDYQIARLLLERGLAALYLIAFVAAARQFPALAGERGLEPATWVLRATRFWQAPSIFHWRYSDRLLRGVCAVGGLIAASLVIGLPQAAPLPVTMLAWLTLWVLYSSVANVGGSFYSFGWETLLLEAGFLAIFLGNAAMAPPFLVIIAYRWLAFRVEFGAGLIKLRGDQCWRDLTCMNYHHETQPMPNPLSWWFHHLPRPLHRLETVGNFVAQLALPFGLFLPQPVASIAATLMIATQLYLVVSGNYAWLNWVTIIVICAGVADPVLGALGLPTPDPLPAGPAWFAWLTVGLGVLILILSYRPVRNLLSPRQAMNASFDPLRLVNTYGAFGSVTRTRYEVVVEGTDAALPDTDAEWREYEFKGKPGDPRRRPPQVAPYHLRLDWLMWFLPISRMYGEGWFRPFLTRLLEGDAPTLRLLRRNPFPDAPPTFVRARLFEYRYTTWQERRATGAWWHREPVGTFAPPVRLP